VNDTSSEMERQVTERYKLMPPYQSAHMTFALDYLTRTDCRMLGIAQIPPALPIETDPWGVKYSKGHARCHAARVPSVVDLDVFPGFESERLRSEGATKSRHHRGFRYSRKLASRAQRRDYSTHCMLRCCPEPLPVHAMYKCPP